MKEAVNKLREVFRGHVMACSILLVFVMTVPTRLSAALLRAIPGVTLREIMQQISSAVWTYIAAVILGFRWCYSRGRAAKTVLCGSALFLLMGAGLAEMIAITVSGHGTEWQSPSGIILGLVTLLRVGFCEESLYRGIIANGICMKNGINAAGVRKSVVLSGAVFGAAHMMNMFYGVDLRSAAAQSLTAWVLGMYLTAVYLRGGNIWVMMLLHSLTDSVGLFEVFFRKDGGTSVEAINAAEYSPWYYYLAFIALTAFLIRGRMIPRIISDIEEAAARDARELAGGQAPDGAQGQTEAPESAPASGRTGPGKLYPGLGAEDPAGMTEETHTTTERSKENKMKHAVLVSGPDSREYGKTVEAELSEGSTVYMAEAEYTQEELAQFSREGKNWILRCRGSRYFLADSDSGEDAQAYYCGYFDPVPERAVFGDGRLVGFYICTEGISYSGRGRYNYSIDDWGFPGQDPFEHVRTGSGTHIFMFSDEDTRRWKNWSLIVRDPEAVYENSLDF